MNEYGSTMNENEVFVCGRCGHKASTRSNLYQHLRRKTPCPAILSEKPTSTLLEELQKERQPVNKVIPCPNCPAKFSSRQAKSKHMKTCKGASVAPIIDKEQMVPLSTIDAIVEKKIKELGILSQTLNNGNINNGTINNNITINVPTLRNFGEENREAIPLHLIRSTFMNLEFQKLFENLHFDPEYPENQNVRIKSVKRNVLEIYKNNRWNTTTSLIGMKEIVEQLYKIFYDFQKAHRDIVLDDEDMSREELEEILTKLDEVRDWIYNADAKLKQCSVVKEIEAVLESNRNALTT